MRAFSSAMNGFFPGPESIHDLFHLLKPTMAGTTAWPAKDIAYTAIVGAVMIAALLEWILQLLAFLYCFAKVYQKAEHVSVRILAVVVSVIFTLLRMIFLPIMVATLPLPTQITQYFPISVVGFLQWFGFWAFAAVLTVPWLFCIYQLVTHSIGRTKRIKNILDEDSAPKIVIVMPCYNEKPEILLTAIDSVVDCDYPPSCIHVFVSFDDELEGELYLKTIERLGVPLSLNTYPKCIDVVYRTARITVSRFPHAGKRHCQKATFKLIDKIYTEYLRWNDDMFILFIDSDCVLDRVCLQNFVYDMELSPGNRRDMLAMTGVITSTTKKHSLITILQDMEYIHGQLFERTVESGCGAVTCLPGALTMLRFSAFRKMAKYYFADKAEQCEDMFDFGKSSMGEDRWLTHLFMVGAKKRYQIQMCTSAFCKTEAVQTFQSLLKQRRRWFLGFITNEACMLTDIRIWKKYPILALVRFMQNTIRTTALLFLIMVISLITTSKRIQDLPVGFIGVSLGLNWIMMIYFGFKLGRYKIWLYPMMFFLNPFFNWFYMVYGIFTAGDRTWGGPRADAGKADSTTTPQQVVEKAFEMGDDLNVVPETFKAAAEARRVVPTNIPLQPPDRIVGRFASPEKTPEGWYKTSNDSINTIAANGTNSNTLDVNGQERPPFVTRASVDSTFSAGTSVYMPRRVESIMGEEDRKKYAFAQANQRAAGGASYLNESSPGRVYEMTEAEMKDAGFTDGAGSPNHRRISHIRYGSYQSILAGDDQEQNPSPSTPPHGASSLAVPQTPSNRNVRSPRSPLARVSMQESAPAGGQEFELEELRQRQPQISVRPPQNSTSSTP